MKMTIKPRIGSEITFSRAGGYIFADLNGKPGCLGIQICRAGRTMGDTISYDGDSEAQFQRICRNWYKAMRAM